MTVPRRIRALGLPDTAELAWKAGAAVRDWWEGNGNPMEYDLLRKTRGPGSHMFAVYPDDAVPKIDQIIQAVAIEIGINNPSQGSLFPVMT